MANCSKCDAPAATAILVQVGEAGPDPVNQPRLDTRRIKIIRFCESHRPAETRP